MSECCLLWRMAASNNEDSTDLVAREAISYACAHGMVMALPAAPPLPETLTHAPFCLRASRFDASAFALAVRTAPLFSKLIHRMAMAGPEFLARELDEASQHDSFTARLLACYLDAANHPRGLAQPVSLGLHRFDYFMAKGRGEMDQSVVLQQVELNTIASSFGCLGTRASHLHEFVHQLEGSQVDWDHPENRADEALSDALAKAHGLWLKRHSQDSSKEVQVIFVVQPGERNRFDQDILRHLLLARHRIRSVRLSLSEIASKGRLSSDVDRALEIETGPSAALVSVVYFRAGYGPGDYVSEACWQARVLMENSTAIKCPSLSYQLLGAKKIQQILCDPEVLTRFADSPKDAQLMRDCFASQWSLSAKPEAATSTRAAIQLALDNPHAFVLKPQREGGGNNLYEADLKKALLTMSADELASHILMSRIEPIAVDNTIVRNGKIVSGQVVGELGIFGTFLGDTQNGDIFLNETAGYLLRSKLATVDDGGVAAGVAVLDSPQLVNMGLH
ncbi:Glutathione synthetase, chloroplastic [Porphyridium purpureum]|uniref:Glutathione synthetase n=1 Tax=Porphyridium purpureum TaxID=35688 RepID=A0A5J4YP86_PORPP|nr:Glutathione synthetase, chloroplastic [Porphyridium purpureum]|eukprot:POR5734..scf295_9